MVSSYLLLGPLLISFSHAFDSYDPGGTSAQQQPANFLKGVPPLRIVPGCRAYD